MAAYINCIAYQMGSREVSNADIIKDFPDWSERNISAKIGIDKRYVAENQTASDLAFEAAEKLFRDNGIERQSIDALLFCTQSPDYPLPTTACVLQDRLKLRTDVMAFDYNLGCSGYVYGCGISKALIETGIVRNVLLLTGETYSRYIHPSDRGNRALFSDAGSATLISSEGGFFEIGNPVYGTDGSGARNIIVEAGGARMQKTGIDPVYGENAVKSPDYFNMDGPAVFNFTLERVPELISRTLSKNNLTSDDIDMYVLHQANKHMLKFIREAVGIPEDKFYFCLSQYGNTISSTLPICLHNIIEEGEALKRTFLVAGFGVGYSWGALILKS